MDMDSLPGEIMVNILSRLPIKSLLRCKSVCKSFLNLTLDPYLIEAHLNLASSHDQNPCLILNKTTHFYFRSHLYYATLTQTQSNSSCDEIPFSPLNFDMFRVLGSCNGLLCLHHGTVNYGIMFVINPCTGKRIEILEMIDWPFRVHMAIGFGFSPKRNEYKVVKVIGASRACVFSLRNGVWREAVGGPSFEILPYSESYVCVNGVIHWASVYGSNSIVRFDVADEVFDVIPCPAGGLQCGQVFLALFSGCLGLIEYGYGENNCFDIWVLKDYNVRESWTRSFSINMNHIGWYGGDVKVLYVQKNSEVLMLHRNHVLWSYDPKTISVRKLNSVGLPHQFEAVCHVGNLASPLGY